MAIDLGGLLKTLTSQYEETRAAKQKRYDEGIGILQSVVEQFGPGYLKGEEKKMLASMEQGMVGRGLGGTTRPAAVGTGIKADIRDRQTRARTGAMTNVAQFMAGFQDIYPQPGTLAHLATGGFSGMLQEALAKAPGGPLGPTQYSAGAGAGGGGGGITGGGGGGGGTGGGIGNGAVGGRTTGPGPGVASATVGFGPSAPTGTGAATYGAGGGEVLRTYLGPEGTWDPIARAGPGPWDVGMTGAGDMPPDFKPKTDAGMWSQFQRQIG